MAKYTVELNDIVKSGLKIFDFPYDFDEQLKPDFEAKFINHFRYREICCETVGRWIDYLKDKVDTVLPYYNEVIRISKMDYDLINNYQLTETFAKTATNAKSTSADTSNTLNRTTDAVNTGEKTNTLNSETQHTEDKNYSRNETQSEASTVDTDNKQIGSDTPNGLLAMADITNNVYASKATIDDNTTKATANKTNGITETAKNTIIDTVEAESHDSTTDTHDENVKETNAGNIKQNETENGGENYTLERIGNIGVDAPSDMLRKHLEFQKTVKRAYLMFFDECEDLFMQVF